ncbi:MAG: hypothetical protein IT449_02660 [Phycisphaerales bacterium]|nr:hypothetical protein [Phycisphaerales bacterium]
MSVFHGLLELRWADLGGTGIEDVLAGSRREWRFMREILSMGEWLSSYVPRDPKTRPHFSNASMDTRNHSDIGAWIHDVETTVVVKSWDTEAWKPSPGANVTVTPWLLHSRTVYSATVELLMIGIPLRLTASCLFVLCAVHAAIKVRRRQLRKRSGTCMKCGYNLTGNVSGVCPECGTACGGTSGSRT